MPAPIALIIIGLAVALFLCPAVGGALVFIGLCWLLYILLTSGATR